MPEVTPVGVQIFVPAISRRKNRSAATRPHTSNRSTKSFFFCRRPKSFKYAAAPHPFSRFLLHPTATLLSSWHSPHATLLASAHQRRQLSLRRMSWLRPCFNGKPDSQVRAAQTPPYPPPPDDNPINMSSFPNRIDHEEFTTVRSLPRDCYLPVNMSDYHGRSSIFRKLVLGLRSWSPALAFTS